MRSRTKRKHNKKATEYFFLIFGERFFILVAFISSLDYASQFSFFRFVVLGGDEIREGGSSAPPAGLF